MDFILNPFISVLTLLYSIFANNMVLAIVVFTVLVRLILFPLTRQQMKSSQAMQQVQPEMKKLQEKYKGDREKLAQAQMELYRQYGVNPLGGCLPLIVQFPIFISLYSAINLALGSTPMQLLDLSGRLVIPGLDEGIPLNNTFLGMNLTLPPNLQGGGLEMIAGIVLIALVVITTWLQFKLTTPAPVPNADGKPDATASMTQSMGTIMPLMYGFFALSFSIGIAIYFIVSNLMGIVQAAMMGRANFSNLLNALPFSQRRIAAPAAATATSTSTAPIKVRGKATPAATSNAPKNAPRSVSPKQNGRGNGTSPRSRASTSKPTTSRSRPSSNRPSKAK